MPQGDEISGMSGRFDQLDKVLAVDIETKRWQIDDDDAGVEDQTSRGKSLREKASTSALGDRWNEKPPKT